MGLSNGPNLFLLFLQCPKHVRHTFLMLRHGARHAFQFSQKPENIKIILLSSRVNCNFFSLTFGSPATAFDFLSVRLWPFWVRPPSLYRSCWKSRRPKLNKSPVNQNPDIMDESLITRFRSDIFNFSFEPCPFSAKPWKLPRQYCYRLWSVWRLPIQP